MRLDQPIPPPPAIIPPTHCRISRVIPHRLQVRSDSHHQPLKILRKEGGLIGEGLWANRKGKAGRQLFIFDGSIDIHIPSFLEGGEQGGR